jgi:hypothetical protein
MEFSSNADVDMTMHDDGEDALLDINLASQFAVGASSGAMGNGLADAFLSGMIPGVEPMLPQALHPTPQHEFTSMEEYAALVGVKLESSMDTTATQQQQHQPFTLNGPTPELNKVQANAAYFENLYRERMELLGGQLDENLTSMTLPAGVGSGLVSPMLATASTAAAMDTSGALYNRPPTLDFNAMTQPQRLYDPSTAVFHPPPGKPPLQPPLYQQNNQPQDHTSQTLSPEILSAMIRNHSSPSLHSFGTFS